LLGDEGEVYYGSRRVVAREQLHDVLARLYADPRAAAASRDRLFEHTSRDFVGISRRAIMDWLRNQEVWQLRQPAFAPTIRQPIVSTRPFQRMQADLVDMRAWNPGLNNGTQYLLTVIDTFTKHAWAVPLPNKEGATVALALDEKVLAQADHAPTVLQTDRGSEFVSAEFQAVLSRYGVKHVLSRPYTPQSQGQIERWHGTLKSMLRTHMAHFKGSRRWVDVLPLVLEGYNSSRHRSTGFAPNDLVVAWRERDSEAAKEKLMKAAERIRRCAERSMTRQKGRQPRGQPLRVGDHVRVKIHDDDTSRFGRHDPVWSERVFRITGVSAPTGLSQPQYQLEGRSGRLYRNDLLAVNEAHLVRRQTVRERPVYSTSLFDMEQHLLRLHSVEPGQPPGAEPSGAEQAAGADEAAGRPRRIGRRPRRLIEEMD
jgi:transposase InsO family protein